MRGLHDRLQEGGPLAGTAPPPPRLPRAGSPSRPAPRRPGEEGTLQHSVCKGLKEAAAAQAKALAEGGRDILDIINGGAGPRPGPGGEGL